MTLQTRKPRLEFETVIDTTQIMDASRLVSNLTGLVVQPNKAIVGANAFAHESGFHQDGMPCSQGSARWVCCSKRSRKLRFETKRIYMSISSFTRSSNRSPLLPTVRSYFSSIALVICWSLAGLLGCGDGGGEPAPLPDFSLSATALTGASPGQKALIAVNAKGVNGHDYPITLTIASNPDHVTGSAEVGLTESGKTANLYAYVPTYASQGPYHLEILGSDGFLTHSLPIDLYTEPSPFSVEVLQNSGDPSKRINIVLLGDGYRAEDQSKLTQDATKCLESFWNTPPYSNYRSFFNVKLVHVVSKENGASSRMNGVGVLRDTALGAYFGALGVDRAVVVDDERVFSTAMAAAPEFSRLLVLVNDTRYGGTGGSIAVVSTDPMSSETFEHEFGHTFANLADEYSDEYEELSGNIEEYPNITAQVDRALIKWTLWILPDTPIPTPNVAENVSRVGLFEGAYYQQFGVYRPRLICKMRLLEVPFCEVCAEATICEVYNDVPIIESASPNVPVSLPSTGSMTFSIAHATPEPNTLGIVWMLDGHSIAHGTDSYQLVGAGMSPGQHLLEVQITDATPLVRNDPGNLLKGTASWTVNVSASAASAQAVIPSFRAEQLLQHRLLHLSWDAGGFRVLDDRIVDLPLPPKRRSDVSSWWVEVVDEGGQVIHHEDLEDPTLLRGEFRNSENSSRIDHIVRHKLPASFMLRLPCSVSGTLRIYARDGKTATSSIAPGLIGTVPLPNR